MMESSKKENNGVSKSKENVPEYGKVVLTVKNCLLPKEKLHATPSQQDGLDAETEADLRVLGCELIQTAGILLRLPQVSMATAQVLFQRFYYSKSYVRQNYEITGMACLYLACKIEESLRRIRDVVNVYHHIKQVNQQKTLAPLILDHTYISLKCQVIKAERRVLKELGFCVHVKHPHKLIVLYLQVLGLENRHNLMQIAWNYMNDSLRTDVFVRYQPETVACACIYLTARKLKIPLPRSPPWFSVFRVEEDDIQDICKRILVLYTRAKPDAEVLEKKVQELCKKFEESRLRNKTGFNNITSGTNTPNSPLPAEKKVSPKRSRDSDRSRSRTASDSPRHKKYKRSRSRSYDKYKKSRSRRSRSNSPSSKTYKDKRYRSRSRSYERNHSRDHKESKYVSDRYKEDRYHGREDRYRRDDDRYRRDDDRYHKEDDYKYKKDDEKYKRDEDAVRIKKDEVAKGKKDEENVIKPRKDEDNYRREDDLVKHRKEEDRRKKEEESHKHKKEKITLKEGDSKKIKSKHTSSKHKTSAEKKKRKKHYDDEIEEDDEIEIIHVKKDKKSR